jgi:peroxiredoxin
MMKRYIIINEGDFMRIIAKIVCSIVIITAIFLPVACNKGTTSTFNEATSNTTNSTVAVSSAPQVGSTAPNFTYTDAEGKPVALSDLRGKTVVLNFWASWCGPCQYEMPMLQKLATDKDKAAQGVVLITVNDGESQSTITNFVKKYGYTFFVVPDPKSNIGAKYNIRYLPTTFFINRDGIIRYIQTGAFQSESDLGQMLNSVMK